MRIHTKRISVGFALLSFFILSGISFAMTINESTNTVQNSKGNDQATGLFGGLRQDGTFVFLYSETKGVRYYRMQPGIRATFSGNSYDISSLVPKTPIVIKVRSGKIVAVELQGVMQ